MFECKICGKSYESPEQALNCLMKCSEKESINLRKMQEQESVRKAQELEDKKKSLMEEIEQLVGKANEACTQLKGLDPTYDYCVYVAEDRLTGELLGWWI